MPGNIVHPDTLAQQALGGTIILTVPRVPGHCSAMSVRRFIVLASPYHMWAHLIMPCHALRCRQRYGPFVLSCNSKGARTCSSGRFVLYTRIDKFLGCRRERSHLFTLFFLLHTRTPAPSICPSLHHLSNPKLTDINDGRSNFLIYI